MMVKPLQARQLPRQSTVSLHEGDLDLSGDELTTCSRELPGEVSDMAYRADDDDDRLTRGEDTAFPQPSQMSNSTDELSNPTLGPAPRTEGVGGGDASRALDFALLSEDSPGTVRHRQGSSLESRPEIPTGDHPLFGNDTKPGQQCDNGQCSGLSAPEHNHFTSSYDCPGGVTPQTAALGRDLYIRFLHDEIRVRNVPEPPCLNPWLEASLDRRYLESLNTSAQARRSLRQVANVFATSQHRECVRQRAASIDIESLDYNSFQELLFGLFQEGGVTSERVVVLFFFCADLTIRALREQLTTSFHHLLDWSQLYFTSTFCLWVERHGGWAAVLDQSANHLYLAAKIGLVCTSIVALCLYIRNTRGVP